MPLGGPWASGRPLGGSPAAVHPFLFFSLFFLLFLGVVRNSEPPTPLSLLSGPLVLKFACRGAPAPPRPPQESERPGSTCAIDVEGISAAHHRRWAVRGLNSKSLLGMGGSSRLQSFRLLGTLRIYRDAPAILGLFTKGLGNPQTDSSRLDFSL